MRRSPLVVVVAGASLAATVVAAPESGSTPLLLSEAQAVELALSQSPELEALGYQLEEDRALVDSAVRINNPVLRVADLRHDNLLLSDPGNPTPEDIELGLRWAPPNLGSWNARRATAERRVDQTEAGLARERRNLVATVRAQHAALVSIEAELALADTAVELRDKLRALIARRMEQQAATALDQSLSELDYLDAIADREQLESERRERYHAFLALLGQPAEAEISLVAEGSPACRMPDVEFEPLVSRARAGDPSLAVLEARLAEVDADISRAWLELIPWFDFVQLSYVMGPQPLDPLRTNSDSVRLRFGVSLPLLDWNQAEITALKARRGRRETEAAAERQRIALRVRRAIDELRGRVSLYESYRQADRSVVDNSLTKIRAALEAGEADLVQMGLVQSRTLRARRAHLRSYLRCQESLIDLERLVGDLPVEAFEATADQPAPDPDIKSEGAQGAGTAPAAGVE